MSVAGVVAQVGVDLLVVLHDPLPQADGGGDEDRTPDVVEAALYPCNEHSGTRSRTGEGSLKGVLLSSDDYLDS